MNKELIEKLLQRLKYFPLEQDIKIMEVCGTHTVQFLKTGIKDFFPKRLHLVDGPGCPVCVTPNYYLDNALAIAKKHNVIIATFGDMVKVPSSTVSLKESMGEGVDVKIVYSPLDALKLAKENRQKEIMFLSVGFETTTPLEAAVVQKAKQEGIRNFSLLTGNKMTPPAVKALLDASEVDIDGFILPGHVSTIIGLNEWKFIAEKYNKPAVIAGFEVSELLRGLLRLLELLKQNEISVVNEYPSAVRNNGNRNAVQLMTDVFKPIDSNWRGIGILPESGQALVDEYELYDAWSKYKIDEVSSVEPVGCRCGELLRGIISPYECPLFGKSCRPEKPVGACMVSSEGPCSAYFMYEGNEG